MSDLFPRVYSFHAYIGPRYTPDNALTDHGQWNYRESFDDPGQPWIPFVGQKQLVSTLTASATTGLSVTPGGLGPDVLTQWPIQAGVWVGPGSSNQGWEYIDYHSSGASIRRNPQPGMNNAHSAGAPVYFWYPLDTNNGTFQLSLEQSDNMAVRQWTAKLSGVRAPAHVLKPDHFFMLTYTTTDSLGWAREEKEYVLFALGLVDRVTISQDSNRRGEWEIDISSMARALQNTSIPGLRIGPMNIALEADASASSTLGAAWKLSLAQRVQAQNGEIPEIDIVETQDDLGPQHAVDDNPNTLWVSDGWVGLSTDYANLLGHQGFASVFAYPPPTHLLGSRYYEIINTPNMDTTWVWVYSKYSYPDNNSPTWRARWFQVTEPNMFAQNGLENDSINGAEKRIIVAENAAIFNRLFPAARPDFLIDAATLSGVQDVEAVRRLWWQGGAIMLVEQTGGPKHLFHWGNVTYAELSTAWDTQGTTDYDLPASNYYLDIGTPPAARPGQVFRRIFTAAGEQYTHDYLHHPGYRIHQNIGDDQSEWFKLTLPHMTHVLRDDLLAGATSIFVIDGNGVPNVEGLTKNAGGWIIINDEVIPFTGKNFDTGELTGCTVTLTHKAGAKVYVRWHIPWSGEPANPGPGSPPGDYVPDFEQPFEGKIFDLATDAFPIFRIKWGRGYYSDGVTQRYPWINNFIWRFSLYEDARDPSTETHEVDYLDLTIDAASHTPSIQIPNAEITTDHSAFDPYRADGFRPKTLLMQIRSMMWAGFFDVTARPRLNYVEVEVDRAYFNPDTWLELPPAGMHNYLFVYYVLAKSGIYLSALTAENPSLDPSPKRFRGMTDRDTAWRVASDAADYGSSIIDVRRDGTISVRPNGFLLNATHTPTRFFSTPDIARLEVINIRPADIGQVRLTWENPTDGVGGTALYPDSVADGEAIVEIGPVLAESQFDANTLAFNHYKTRRFAYNVFVELNTFQNNIELGEIHSVSYDFDQRGELISKVLLVESVEYEFSELRGRTVIGYREIEREVA